MVKPVYKGRDALAGIELAAMSIPQVLGYTRIAGVPAVTGLYTLLLPLVAFATFGSSRYLVVAADSATAAILAGGLSGMAPIASARYMALAGMVALLTAAFLFLARLLRLGFLADFLSQTVLVGFLTGVGIQVGIAVSGQMLGPSLGLSALVVAGVLAIERFAPRIPGPMIAVAGSVIASAVWDFAGHGIPTLGPIASGLPHLTFPHVSWRDVKALVPVAGSCFVMILAQSAAVARVYASRHLEEVNENADLIGLSAANAAAALSGTFVVNGSPTQTAMMESSGGRRPISQIATAAVVALVLMFLTRPLQYLPQCVLASIVFVVAIRLVDLRGLRDIRRESPDEFWLAVTTAGMVVLAGVEQGIILAMVLSLLRIVRHSYHPHTEVLVEEPGLVIYRFSAALFYANAGRFTNEIRALVNPTVRWIVVDAGAITKVDYTAARKLEVLHTELTVRGIKLVFAHVEPELKADLERHHLTPMIFDKLHEAVAAYSSQT